MILLFLYGCDPKDDTAAPPVDCAAMCSDLEATVLSVLEAAGSPSTPEAWQAHCAGAGESTCDECYRYLQAGLGSAPVSMDCGCGLTTAGVAECTADPEVTDEQASAAIASCEATCVTFSAP